MSRARGANAVIAFGFEPSYGEPAASGSFFKKPIVTESLGEEQGLVASDVIGFGRDPQQPGRDAVDDNGDIVSPMCARNLGLDLKALFGAPATAQGVAASGSLTFSAQPANNSTITIAGQAFTFVTGTPTANQIKIGSTLRETLANAVRALNASAVSDVAAATYSLDARGKIIRVVNDTLGTSGNAFTLVAGSSPASNATVSGATLTGGAATGAYHHTFVAGAQDLSSASVEIGMPEVPSYALNYGGKANTWAIQLARSGNLNYTVGWIFQGEETPASSSVAGSLTEMALAKFSHFSGIVRRAGVPIADLVAGQFNFSNGLDPVPTIGRGDGRIGGVDEGGVAATGMVGIRYSTREFQILAEDGTPTELEYVWSIPGTVHALRIIVHEVYLPKSKTPITGPTGIQADYNWQAAEHPTLHRTVTVVLSNDVASY